MADIRAVVAIDFGSTFSGFAYSNRINPEIITNDVWPQQIGQLKTNTALRYDSNYLSVTRWGNPAFAQKQSRRNNDSTSLKPVELFKLHLGKVPQNEKPSLPNQLSYEKAISDYLRELGKLIKETIDTRWCGLRFFEHILLVISVPAEFDDHAKDTMRKCIYNAELTDSIISAKVKFLTESEAAAIYCMQNLEGRSIPINESFMVVDCGGRTVGLTTFKLLQHNKLSETSKRTGNFYGGSYVDLEFLRFLSRKLGESTIDLLKKNNYGQMNYMIQQFCQNFKFNFTGNRNNFNSFEFDIEEVCPALKQYCSDDIRKKMEKEDWTINIKFEDLKFMFDPIVEKIIGLIRERLNSNKDKCSVIFLVGGFSESKYLQMKVKEEFGKLVSLIIAPKQPITAIVRGACDYGLKIDLIQELKGQQNEESIKGHEFKKRIEFHAEQVVKEMNEWNQYVSNLSNELCDWREKYELIVKERDSLKESLKTERDSNESLRKDLSEFNRHLYNLNNQLSIEKAKYEQLEEQLKHKGVDYHELYKENQEPKGEASQHSALGDAMNYHELKTVKNERDILKKQLEYMFNVNNELNTEKAKLEQNLNIWKENNRRLGEHLDNKGKQYNELYKKNQELKNEVYQYQTALGDARNYRLGDDDANNPTQLAKVIDDIQDKINDFCKVKGGVDINEQQILKLLEKYKCTSEPGDKVLAKAALQRFIIEIIVSKTEEYLKTPTKEIIDRLHNKIKEPYLELDVLNSTSEYLLKLNNFINSREGTDVVSIEAPKKIRQLVHAVFGDRGFGLNKDKKEHEFIQKIKDDIIKAMDSFRTIKKVDKKKENEDMIAEIIRDVIKMFFFRIRVLEPPGGYEWIPKDYKVDPTLMEVGSLEDDNYEDWVVNLCSFPLISVQTGNERKVLVPAKIQAIKVGKKAKRFSVQR